MFQVKDSNDKRGWSFRKRSARHRVLSNTVVTTETTSSANKEIPEYTSTNFQSPAEPNVVEKICTTDFSDEKPQLSSNTYSEISEKIVTEAEGKVDVNPPESAVIIVQTAIRAYLAQRALLKSKNVVKLQAAVRGHLVRRHAVGTLRCVQAIVKMQLLVRARHAQKSQLDGKNDYSKTSDNEKHTSVEKLLSNKFARQLLESTPKDKPIHVKCNPSKGDSAWKWLERWMPVPAKDSAENKKPISVSEQSDETKDSTHVSQLETDTPSHVILQLADSPLPSEDEEKTSTYDDTNSYFQASPSTSSLIKDNLEEAPPEKTVSIGAKVSSNESEYFQKEILDSNASVPQEPSSHQNPETDGEQINHPHGAKIGSNTIDSVEKELFGSNASVAREPSSPQNPESDSEPFKQPIKAFASDQLETEGKKVAGVSRKLSNPAFIAAQSKFEELSSNVNSGRPSSLFDQDVSVESQADTAYISKEFISSENSTPYPSRIGDPETVLSISSTLDSPDRSETLESEHDAKDLAEGIVNPGNNIDYGVEANTPTSNLPISDSDRLETVNDSSGNIVDSVIPENFKEPAVEPEVNASDLLREKTETVLPDSKLSASPGSYMTIPESQGTPSSQVSVKPNKINKTGSSGKRRALSMGNKSPANSNNDSGSRVAVGNKSPANANHDSGSRGSREQLPKDQLNGKRRNSIGSIKPDQTDQEPARDNSSSNSSLPRFMQATQSARAKINANSSPRSSPDVHDPEVNIKKRHSLPGATGKQGSPRVEQSISPAQQGTKGNGSTERKWQR
ncbi:IQ-domain [Trifolium repens]|nr:IQ-domain [Trifolium repens]